MEKLLQSIKEAVAEKQLSSELLIEFVELRDSDKMKDEDIKKLKHAIVERNDSIDKLQERVRFLESELNEFKAREASMDYREKEISKAEAKLNLDLANKEIACLKSNIENIKEFNQIIFKNTVVRNKVLTNITKSTGVDNYGNTQYGTETGETATYTEEVAKDEQFY